MGIRGEMSLKHFGKDLQTREKTNFTRREIAVN